MMACDTEDKMAAVLNAAFPSIIKELDAASKGDNDEECVFMLQQLVANFKMFTSPLLELNKV